jgi:mRNA-degrading endonuclease toxin of MazEF toxin-antitoxin module
MTGLSCGSIVWIELPDPQGKNPKRRPAVVVTAAADLVSATEVWVAAITTRIDALADDERVDLPWHRDGHPRTGLRERCAAVCSWLQKVPIVQIPKPMGIVPDKQLFQILGKIGKLPE